MSPNEADILNYLTVITYPWKHETERGDLEIRCIAEGSKVNVERFDIQRIRDAVQHASAMNSKGLNIYACVNPANGSKILPGKAASDDHIHRAHFAFADCDEMGVAEKLINNAPQYDFCVVTGSTPHLRCHYYWQFLAPISNLSEWTNLQKMLAAKHASDPQVCNPSRIMRVAGTIAFPSNKKKQQGYTIELTHMKGAKRLCQLP